MTETKKDTETHIINMETLLEDWHRQQRSATTRTWDIATKLCVPAMIVLVGSVLILREDVAVIKATRFTAADWANEKRLLEDALPPMWLREDIKAIKSTLQRYETTMARIEQLAIRQKENSDDIDTLEETLMRSDTK